jgi:hypothetical protein
MSEEDTLILPPQIRNDPLLTALVRVLGMGIFIVGAFVGAALFALGIAVGVLL